MALENDKILPHVTVSVYQRPAQVENINHPVHVTVFAHQNTVVITNDKILPHAGVSVYLPHVHSTNHSMQIHVDVNVGLVPA